MIRAVVDTNLIVSAFFWGGLPLAVLKAAGARKFRMIASDALVDELQDVLSRPKFSGRLAEIGETVESLLDDYRVLVAFVEPMKIDPIITDDPDDDALIACALGGEAGYIISGDRHLLDLGQYQYIKMLTVRQFMEEIVEN